MKITFPRYQPGTDVFLQVGTHPITDKVWQVKSNDPCVLTDGKTDFEIPDDGKTMYDPVNPWNDDIPDPRRVS